MRFRVRKMKSYSAASVRRIAGRMLFLLVGATIAITLSMTSCVREKKLTSIEQPPGGTKVVPKEKQPVVFMPMVGAGAKSRAADKHPVDNDPAVKDNGVIPEGKSFGVYGWVKPDNINPVTNFTDLENEKVTRTIDGVTGKDVYTYKTAFWPMGADAELSFLAYYPYVNQTTPAPTDPLIKVQHGTGANISLSIEYTVSNNSGDHVDLMYARKELIPGYDTVRFNFRHALSRIMFDGRIEGFLPSPTPDVKITGIKIKNAVLKGELTVLDPGPQPQKAWWTLSSKPVDKGAISMPVTHILSTTLTSTAQHIMKSELWSNGADGASGDMLMLPQSVEGLELEVTILYNGSPYTRTYPLDGMPDWEMNEITVYEITVHPDKIELSSSVFNWTTYEIDGSSINPYLTVSTTSIDVSRFGEDQRVYFYANQGANVSLLADGKVGTSSGSSFTLNTVFTSLPGSNFVYDPGTGRGYIDLELTGPPSGSRYLIYLTSSNLRREIEVNVNYITTTEFTGWLYVKKGSTGDGLNWTKALPTIDKAIVMANKMKAAGFTIQGILVAGGPQRIYPESVTISNGLRIFGGWEGLPGTELPKDIVDAPYTSTHRKLKDYKAVVTGNVTVTGTGSLLDGFSVWGYTGTTNNAVSVANGAYINAVEITSNAPTTGGGSAMNALSVDNAQAVNVLVADNAGGVSLTNYSMMLNGTIVNNKGASVCNNSTMVNTIIWSSNFNSTTFTFTGSNSIAHCAMPEPVQAGTKNYPIHLNNVAWFTVNNVIPGPHFNLGADPTRPLYAALSNRAPMMGRGDQGMFDLGTPFMPMNNKTDINGNPRHIEWTDIGCYEDAKFQGFRLRWATDRVYLSSRGGVVNDIPLLLPENEEQQIGVIWQVKVSSVVPAYQSVWTPPTPSSGSGSGVMVGVLQITTLGANYVQGGQIKLGSINIHTNLGAYLPDADFEVWRVPGQSALWEDSFVGAFWRNTETSERYIIGPNSYATFSNTPGVIGTGTGGTRTYKYYYTHWEARIVSGLDWIKIDANDRGAFGGVVQETFGGMVKGTTPNNATGKIKFRVGLKSINPNPSKPRYGLIIIMRGNVPSGQTEPNYTGAAWFFVRQGEEADYIYGPTDLPHPVNIDNVPRPFAVKFSPYNIQHPGNPIDVRQNNAADGAVNAVKTTSTKSTAVFTQYPTQVGDFFQRNGMIAFRRGLQSYALSTTPPAYTTDNVSDGKKLVPATFARDVCPPGYRHPTYGEIAHSLYDAINYTSTTGAATGYNGGLETMLRGFVWGYYADGYFDQIMPDDISETTGIALNRGIYFWPGRNAGLAGNVAAGKGMLMVNHKNYASCYFPMAGTMGSTAATVKGIQQDFNYIDNPQVNLSPAIYAPSLYRLSATSGVTGMYPSRNSISTANTHWIAGHVGLSCTTISNGNGTPIRCVKAEPGQND